MGCPKIPGDRRGWAVKDEWVSGDSEGLCLGGGRRLFIGSL